MVDDAARAMATQQLAMIAARKAAKQAKGAAWAAQNPPAAEPTPEPTLIPLAPPEPEPQVEVIENPGAVAHTPPGIAVKAAGAASIGPSSTVTQSAFPFRAGLSSTDLIIPFGSRRRRPPKSSPERHLSPLPRRALGSALGKSVRPPIRVKSLMHHASGWQQRPHDPHPPVDLGRVPDAGEAGCPVCPFVWHRTSRLLAWGSRPRARNLQGRSLPRS